MEDSSSDQVGKDLFYPLYLDSKCVCLLNKVPNCATSEVSPTEVS